MVRLAVIALSVSLGIGPLLQRRPVPTPIFDALNLYASSQFDAALALVVGGQVDSVAALAFQMRSEGDRWLANQPATSATSDAHVLLAFDLEIARSVYTSLQRQHGLLATDAPPRLEVEAAWKQLRPAIEQACEHVRAADVTSTERSLWQVSIDVFRLFRDQDVIPFEQDYAQIKSSLLAGHLEHVARRLPDEPMTRLATAERLLREEGGIVGARREMPRQEARDQAAHPELSDGQLARTLVKQLAAEEILTPIARDRRVGPAVALHLGSIALGCGEHDRARRFYDEAALSPQPRLRYLAIFLRAWLDDGDQRLDDAEKGYRSAIAVLPGAQSASTALALLLSLTNRPQEGHKIAASAVSINQIAEDPWPMYRVQSYWSDGPTLVTQMRTAMRGGK